MHIYKIRDLALKSGRVVYSIQQLANLINKPKNITKVYASRLVKHGMAKRLIRGRITFEDDDFIIASQLIEPSYISLNSALLFHNVIMQVPKYVECITTKRSINYYNLGIVYHKVAPSLFYGYKRYGKNNSYVFVADPEKALIDGIYLNVFSKKDYDELSKKMNIKKIKQYIKRFEGKGSNKLMKMIK